jgi:UPF0755 protein
VRRILLLAVLLSAPYLLWVYETRFPLRSLADPPQLLVVPQGASAESIGQELGRLGVARHPALFRALALLQGAGGRLRAGEYALEGPLSLRDILDKLVRGDVVRHELTIPEGKSLPETAALAAARGVDAKGFWTAARDPLPIHDLDPLASDLEGYLFPDTYDVPLRPDAGAALVARMVQRFREVMVPELPRVAARGLTLRQVVTLASLVELETARPDERSRIAAVFLNRLKRNMPLQSDPTIIYALRNSGSWDGNIRKKDLALTSPYNTYVNNGLPPGPIASPGREALLAVLAPADVEDIYFVSRNDGTHEFSETLAEHTRAVERYQRRRSSPSGEQG